MKPENSDEFMKVVSNMSKKKKKKKEELSPLKEVKSPLKKSRTKTLKREKSVDGLSPAR